MTVIFDGRGFTTVPREQAERELNLLAVAILSARQQSGLKPVS